MSTSHTLRYWAGGAAIALAACAAQAQPPGPGMMGQPGMGPGTMGPRTGMGPGQGPMGQRGAMGLGEGMMGGHLGIAYERAVADGTADQKARMHTLVQAAEADLQPLRQQLRDGHRQAMQLLSQPKVDRSALETVRAHEVQILDQISRRLVRAGADAAELMTPAQRARFFNERLQHRGNY
ncbi:periplasmic heavy metal sensor [Massilia arenosa]|uniref:Periplasmic heavy metal sensor n=1 Tax=Zemynaea arenosa TaxID=2561931 RepID=A0A4Y9SLF2_9BURK|nr:periplasmic heavy metal sensor [Massilia arenosa]TFW27368.1 periplasmic heavy metal sensor [Massilia arenosa]